MTAHAIEAGTIEHQSPLDSNAPSSAAFETYMLGSHPIARREIASCIATDGFSFLAYKEHWSDAEIRANFNKIGDFEGRLTGLDCQSYVSGLTKYLDNPEQLQSFVTGFTRALLNRWKIL